MSASDKEISNVGECGCCGLGGGGCVGGDGDDDEDDETAGGEVHAQNVDVKRNINYGYGGFKRDVRKAKQVVLHQFTKAKKQLRTRNNKRGHFSSFGAGKANASSSGKAILGGGGKGCCFCLMQPQAVESSTGSHTSDPDGPNFTYGVLRTLIEKNDFYSKECNTHLD